MFFESLAQAHAGRRMIAIEESSPTTQTTPNCTFFSPKGARNMTLMFDMLTQCRAWAICVETGCAQSVGGAILSTK